jgi:DNA-binding NarL/FixJ family response regulator
VIRVLVVDGDASTRDSLRSALGVIADIEIVADAETGEEAVSLVEELEPDVVIMDVDLSGMDGIEATSRIRASRINTKVILLTKDQSQAGVSRAIQAGASGYFLDNASADELVNAARMALQGKTAIDAAVTQAFVGDDRRPEAPLSRREVEILRMVAYGSTGKDIAKALGISQRTVKAHLQRIFEKLQTGPEPDPPSVA